MKFVAVIDRCGHLSKDAALRRGLCSLFMLCLSVTVWFVYARIAMYLIQLENE